MGSIPKTASKDVCRDGGNATAVSYHLENQGTDKRRKIAPKAMSVDLQKIYPENKDYKSSRIITFYHNTGDRAVRFTDDCFTINLTAEVKNTLYGDASANERDKNRKWDGMTPFEKIFKTTKKPSVSADGNSVEIIEVNVADGLPRAYFFNPITGGAVNLVSEVEILLDGQVVQVDRGGFLSITNTLNRLFVPSTRRTEIVGHPYILHNEEDKKMLGNATDDETKFLYKSPSYEYALNSLNAVGKKTGKKAVQLKSDLDGIFLLSRPKNLGLEAISKCHSGYNQHPLIPPNTEICIRMRLNDPLHLRLIDSGIDDADFFNTKDNDDKIDDENKFKFADVNFEIHDISLTLQKIRWDNEKIQKQLRGGSVTYNFDQYVYRAHALPSNQTLTITKEKIPAHTELIYIAFMKSNQLFRDGSMQRSSDGSRFAFPPKLTNIVFRLDGNVILFENGLSITRNNMHSDSDADLFYKYLVNRNLTTDSFESFFPKSPNIGYKNAIPLDLTTFDTNKPTDLSLECRFATGSPSDYYIVMFMPQSVTISRSSPNGIWETTATIS